MSTRPTLSVYIPNYNHAEYLPAALYSIFTQSWQPDEVIVIDDGSTDNSIEILQAFARQHPTLRVIRNGTNRGVVYTMNRALSEVRGDYVCGTSADDQILPGFFELSMSMLAQYPQAGLCCSDTVHLNGETGEADVYFKDWSDTPKFFTPSEFAAVVNGGYIDGHTAIVKRTACLEAGGFLESLRWHCDWFLVHVVAFRYGVCYLPEPLSALRVMPTSYSAKGKNNPAEQEQVLRTLLETLKTPPMQPIRDYFLQGNLLKHFGDELTELTKREPMLLS